MLHRNTHPTPRLTLRCVGMRQRGLTLILVLIFIVSLSLVAAVAMRNVNTGERVVANERDRALGFQAAESAGREAIAKITAGTASALASGYYPTPLARGGDADFWRTSSSLTADSTCAFTNAALRFDWTACSAGTASDYGNSTLPRYAIEKLPDVVVSASVTEHWYRITTRASGKSGEADVILQVMFTTP